MDKGLVLISGSAVYRLAPGGKQWFLVKHETNSNWELPKASVRRGESSVRTSLRIMAERAGMKVKILDEAGRFTSTSVVNGKSVQQRHLYYLCVQKGMEGEAIGFPDSIWLTYDKAVRKLASKREQDMLREAHRIVHEREKAREKRRKEKAKLK